MLKASTEKTTEGTPTKMPKELMNELHKIDEQVQKDINSAVEMLKEDGFPVPKLEQLPDDE